MEVISFGKKNGLSKLINTFHNLLDSIPYFSTVCYLKAILKLTNCGFAVFGKDSLNVIFFNHSFKPFHS